MEDRPAYFEEADVASEIDLITQIRKLESRIENLQKSLVKYQYELEKAEVDVKHLRSLNTAQTNIKWREAIIHCLEVDEGSKLFTLKSAMSVSNCIVKKYAISIDRDTKNKIASTLSFLFTNGKIGRTKEASYYGLLKFFEDDRTTLKPKYSYLAETTKPVIL